MKKFPYILVLSLVLSALAFSPALHAGSKGMEILDNLNDRINDLERSKEYANRKLLLVIGDKRKSTTIENFLVAVKSVLSESQYHLFTLPLVMTQIQNLPVAKVTVNGTVITDLKVGNQVAPDHAGLAELFIIYDGNLALPNQVLANVKIE